MLKLALVLGCLLSLTLAQPMEHQRVARSSSDSNSGSNSNEVSEFLLIQTLNVILSFFKATTTTATTTTAAGTTLSVNQLIAQLVALLG
uniref:Uncharacterized protein n=1 Tax=Oryzias melastigma TaxID=30732 RepID=A0A3B3D9Q5_ORYME